MGVFDALKSAYAGYQDMLPEWATQEYNIMPDLAPQIEEQFPGAPGGRSMSGMYDFLRSMTSVNPSIDIPLSAAGGLAGRALKGIRGARMADDVGQYMGAPKSPSGGGIQAALGVDDALPNPGAGGLGRMQGPNNPLGRGGIGGQEMASGHPTFVNRPRPNNFRQMDELGVLDEPGVLDEMDPNVQHELLQMSREGSLDPGLPRMGDWPQLGPDDFPTRDHFMKYQDDMAMGPGGPLDQPGYLDDMWAADRTPPGAGLAGAGEGHAPMNMMARSDDPVQLIRQAAEEMVAQGIDPMTAWEAAKMQFSDLLIP